MPVSVPVLPGIVHTGIVHLPKIKKKGGEEADFTDSNIGSPMKGLTLAMNQRFMETKLM